VIAGASGQTLYLVNTGLSSTTTLDSLKLKSDGKFVFKQPRLLYPDFYRLILNSHEIHFSVDSNETITFTADAHNFEISYSVEGSENSKAMKEIMLAQKDANQELQMLRKTYGLNLIPDSVYQASIQKAVTNYKDIAKKYIFGEPKSAVAYFALFQQIDGLWFFDLYDRTDFQAYGAVATSYKTFYPDNPRSKQLEQLALQSLHVIRGERRKTVDLPENVQEISFIDIELPDVNGKKVKLSDVAKGKAVLVIFTAFESEWSAGFNMNLNDLYGKYNDKGFEIYQVSLDNDIHFWKNAASKIPWTCVHDPQSIYSTVAANYNVRQLPVLYLINKKGEMVKRIESNDTIESDIKAAL
jgi:glutathione peroxidase-family protein